MSAESDDYVIERFTLEDSHFAPLVELVREVYIGNHPGSGGTIALDDETFRLIFGSPHLRRDLFVRAIHRESGDLVGFLGGIPRDLVHRGKTYRFGVPAWLAVHPGHRRRGLANRMAFELLEIAKSEGFDGGLALFEPEEHGIDTARSLARQGAAEMYDVVNVDRFLIRILDVDRAASVVKMPWIQQLPLRALARPSKVKNPRVRSIHPEDAPHLYELLRDHVDRNELAVTRDRDDFSWYLRQPALIGALHDGPGGKPNGFVVAWEFQLAGFGKSVPFGWVDVVHLHRLTRKEAREVLRYLCQLAHRRGWAGLHTPDLPYFDAGPFYRSKFVFYPKKLVVSLLTFEHVNLPEAPNSFYFDWR